jgi:O-antigen/teichoic acid export membrane protein
LSLVLAIYYLQKYVKSRAGEKTFSGGKEVWAYSIPIFIMSISTNSMYMSDVILAKHFFDPHLSGIYASLSTLGRIIFYGTAPVSAVMFPLISKSFAKKGNYRKIFFLSLLLTLSLCLGILTIYYLFPKLVIGLLYGSGYIEGVRYLVWFGLFMAVFTIDTLILNYFLSRNVTKPVYLSLIASIVQVIVIWFFHSSILEVVRISLGVSLILLVSLVIYFAYETYLSRNSNIRR